MTACFLAPTFSKQKQNTTLIQLSLITGILLLIFCHSWAQIIKRNPSTPAVIPLGVHQLLSSDDHHNLICTCNAMSLFVVVNTTTGMAWHGSVKVHLRLTPEIISSVVETRVKSVAAVNKVLPVAPARASLK